MSAAALSAKLKQLIRNGARYISLEDLGKIGLKKIGLSLREQTHDGEFKERGLVFQGYLPPSEKELLRAYQGSCHLECSLGESRNPRIHVAPRNLPCFITPVGTTWYRGRRCTLILDGSFRGDIFGRMSVIIRNSPPARGNNSGTPGEM